MRALRRCWVGSPRSPSSDWLERDGSASGTPKACRRSNGVLWGLQSSIEFCHEKWCIPRSNSCDPHCRHSDCDLWLCSLDKPIRLCFCWWLMLRLLEDLFIYDISRIYKSFHTIISLDFFLFLLIMFVILPFAYLKIPFLCFFWPAWALKEGSWWLCFVPW